MNIIDLGFGCKIKIFIVNAVGKLLDFFQLIHPLYETAFKNYF